MKIDTIIGQRDIHERWEIFRKLKDFKSTSTWVAKSEKEMVCYFICGDLSNQTLLHNFYSILVGVSKTIDTSNVKYYSQIRWEFSCRAMLLEGEGEELSDGES